PEAMEKEENIADVDENDDLKKDLEGFKRRYYCQWLLLKLFNLISFLAVAGSVFVHTSMFIYQHNFRAYGPEEQMEVINFENLDYQTALQYYQYRDYRVIPKHLTIKFNTSFYVR
ncbi:unnamed protein product, partial [Owenia fusiformis]